MRTNFLSYICRVIVFYALIPASVHSAPAQTENTDPQSETSICTGNAEKGARRHTADTTRTGFVQKISIPRDLGIWYCWERIREKEEYDDSTSLDDLRMSHKYYEGFIKLPEEWRKRLGRGALITGAVDMLLNPVDTALEIEKYGEILSGEIFFDYGLVVRKESEDASGQYTVLFRLFQGYDKQEGPQYEFQEINRAVCRELGALGKKANVLISIVDSSSIIIEAVAPGTKNSDIETEVKKYTFFRSGDEDWLLERVSEVVIRKVDKATLSVDSLHYVVKPAHKTGLFGNDDAVKKTLCSKESYTVVSSRYYESDPPSEIIPQLKAGDTVAYFLPLISSANRPKAYLLIADGDIENDPKAKRNLFIVSKNENNEWGEKVQLEIAFEVPIIIHAFMVGDDWFNIRTTSRKLESFHDFSFKYDSSKRSWNLSGESMIWETWAEGRSGLNTLSLFKSRITYRD